MRWRASAPSSPSAGSRTGAGRLSSCGRTQRARSRLRCRDVQVVASDATAYQLPSDITVVFFDSPFWGPVLSSVLNNIRDSLIRAPRELWIVFKNPKHVLTEPDLDGWLTIEHKLSACDADHKIVIFKSRPCPPQLRVRQPHAPSSTLDLRLYDSGFEAARSPKPPGGSRFGRS